MKEIAAFFASLFQGAKVSIKWVIIIILLAMLIFGFWQYERLSGHFYLARLESKVSLLKDLQSVSSQGFENHPELLPSYKSAVNDLDNFDVSIPLFPTITLFNITTTANIWKAISGASIWILILIVGLAIELGKAHKITGMIAGLFFVFLFIAALFAWFGTLIPTLLNPWVNYLGFPILQLGILLLLTRKKKSRQVI